MASAIDATQPAAGSAGDSSPIRGNFATAKSEITALQSSIATLQSNNTGTNTGDQTSVTGNAGTATALQTARNINGVAFDGTANITINAVDSTARVAKAGDTMTGTLTTSVGTFASTVADGASAVGFDFSTSSYTTAGALVARLRNNATTVFSVDKDGAGFIRGPLTIGTSAAASGLSFPGSGATTTLTVNEYGDNLICNKALISTWGLQTYAGSIHIRGGNGGVVLGSGNHYGFSSSTDGAVGAADIRLYRGTAGRFDVCTSNSSTYGDVKLRSLISSGGTITLSNYTVATLPTAASNTHAIVAVTDGNASPTYRGAVTGGGSTKGVVYCDGSSWMWH